MKYKKRRKCISKNIREVFPQTRPHHTVQTTEQPKGDNSSNSCSNKKPIPAADGHRVLNVAIFEK